MSLRNSIICIARDINMDRSYKNTLALDSMQIVRLCQAKSIYMDTNYSFIRTENRIKIQAPYEQIWTGNYCYIKNRDVLQFFFVTDVRYIADGTTEIKVEEDVLTTYKSKGFVPAYCERQHPQTDEKYANTVTEPITPSNYRKNGAPMYLDASPDQIIGIFTEHYTGGSFIPPTIDFDSSLHLGNALHFAYFNISKSGLEGLANYFQNYVEAGKAGDLVDARYSLGNISLSNPRRVTLPEPDGIQYHQPKNKKLYNYPYTFVQFSNNNGSVLQLKPELLESRQFLMVSAHTTSGNQAFAFPENYMGRVNNFDYGLMIDNYPHIELPADSLAEWYGKASREFKQGLIGKLASAGLSIALAPVTGGFSLAGAAMAVGSVVTDMTTIATHSDDTPDTVKGQSGGDLISQVCSKFNFRLENMSLPKEQAEVVDDFFTRFGYAQSNTMPINVTNPRFHCHYVKTAPGECVIQGIPQEKADIINAAFNNGITFWDSNENYGNYNLK